MGESDYARLITIGGKSFTTIVNQCTFEWDEHGPSTASLMISSADFDEFFGIERLDEVVIKYSSISTWWVGYVDSLSTDLNAGLSISCIGKRIKLNEIIPYGRYGSEVQTLRPSGIAVSLVNLDEGEESSHTGAVTYYYGVTSIDEIGETYTGDATTGLSTTLYSASATPTSTQKVKIAWNEARGATAYRVYRSTNANLTGGVYFETSELEYYDDNTVIGTTCDFPFDTYQWRPGYGGSYPPTARVPEIDDYDAKKIFRHLLGRFLPSGLHVADSTLLTGDDTIIDDLNFDDSEADLFEAMNTITSIIGQCHWYIDVDDYVYLKDYGTTVSHTFVIQERDVVTTDYNVLVNATRKLSRDGIAHVKIEGEEAFEDEYRGTGDVDWDSTTMPDDPTPDSGEAGDRVNITKDYRFFSADGGKNASSIEPTMDFINGYATLKDWLNDYPNLRSLYLLKSSIPNAMLLRMLFEIKNRVPKYNEQEVPLSRGRLSLRRAPGVQTVKTAACVAINHLIEYKPNPEQWTLSLERVLVLHKPGNYKLRVKSLVTDTEYDLEFQKVSYSFEQTVLCSITAGDKIFDLDTRDSVISNSKRKVYRNVWLPHSAKS